MKILFFDTETTGKPKDYRASYTDVNNWPRVISLGWILADETGKVLTKSYDLVKPDGWIMPTEPFWIEHGYTHEQNEAEGVPIAELLKRFYQDKLTADLLVGHNLMFDHNILWAEFILAGMEPRSGMAKFCTMMKTTSVCKVPNKGRGGYKWPTLSELYQFCFNKTFDGAHDALADVSATKDCFFHLLNNKLITL